MTRITIIGGGPGGYVAAFAAAKAGAAVTLVEASALGGTCLNWGCIPTKTLRASADAVELVKHCKEFGVDITGDVAVSMEAVIARKDKVQSVLRTGLEKTCAALKITVLQGTGSLESATSVAVAMADGSKQVVASDYIILATGSSSLQLPNLPIDHKHIMSSDDALQRTDIPERLLIVGGGVIGCEMAFIYKSFGSKVTIVEGQSRLLPIPSVDEEMSKLIQREAKKSGINAELARTVESVEVQSDGSVKAVLAASPFVPTASPKPNSECIVDAVLVTIGRVPNSKNLGLDAVGVKTDARGWIEVNEHMQTSVPNIYAVGDALGPAKVMLAHVASTEGLCAVANCLGRKDKKEVMDYSTVPSGIFTAPEIGTVGITEAQAKEQGIDVKVNLFQFRELGKAQAMGELAGVFKLIVHAQTGKVLGAHIAGAHATDLIAEATLAIKMGATAADIASTIHAHPTLAEGVYEAALGLTE